MTAPKKPQDRKPRAAESEECFTFTHDGESHTLKPTLDALGTGFLRRIRKLSDLDAFFTILEELADEEQLEVIDGMSRDRLGQLSTDFYKHLGATRGESTAS